MTEDPIRLDDEVQDAAERLFDAMIRRDQYLHDNGPVLTGWEATVYAYTTIKQGRMAGTNPEDVISGNYILDSLSEIG